MIKIFRVQLKAGLHFKIKERVYQILKVLHNRDVEVRDEQFHEILIYRETELKKLLNSGDLIFEAKGKNYTSSPNAPKKFEPDFNDLTLDIKKEVLENAKFRFIVIKALLNNSTRTRKDVINRVNEIKNIQNDHALARELFGFSIESMKISVTSVYRWIMEYEQSSFDNHSLISSFHKCGGKGKHRIIDEIIEMIISMINQYYLTQQRLTISDIYLKVINQLEELSIIENKNYDKPSYPTVARIIQDIPEAELVLKRIGKKRAKDKYGSKGEGVHVERPLERVEIDHTELDVILIDEFDFKHMGRPTFTVAIDKYSRMILGFCVGFEKAGYSTVMQCMRHLLMDKSYVKEKYPSVENQWNSYGVPRTIITDNGPEFHSKAFEDACFQLGILFEYAPRKTPEWKGSVERYLRTLQTGLTHKMPGTTRSNVQDRGEEDPSKSACIPFHIFLELLHKWVIDIYSQRLNKGAKGIPSKVWEHGVKSYPPAWPNSTYEIPILLGLVTERHIRAKGVELEGLYYNSKELNSLLYSFTTENNGYNQSFKIKWDPLDIGDIYVYDHLIYRRWLKVPAVDQTYAKGKTSWEHKLCRKVAREKFSKVDIVSLAKAHNYILEMIDKWYSLIHGDRSKYARLKGIGSSKHIFNDNCQQEEKNGKNIILNESSSRSGISDVGMAPVISKEGLSTDNIIDLEQEKQKQNKERKKNKSNKTSKSTKKQEIEIVSENSSLDMTKFGSSLDSDND